MPRLEGVLEGVFGCAEISETLLKALAGTCRMLMSILLA